MAAVEIKLRSVMTCQLGEKKASVAMSDGGPTSLRDQRDKCVKWRERAKALTRVAIPNNLINCTEIAMRGEGQLS